MWWPLVFLAVMCWAGIARGQVGDVRGVHDPSIVRSGNSFYVFSTGRGIQVRKSTDLFHWTRDGRVFDKPPAWTDPFRGNYESVWAADVSVVDGQYRCYYAVSTFGSTHSAIGLVVNSTLDRADKKFQWVDKGMVISTPAKNDWNAIDPCGCGDGLVLGSCWTGIKHVRLNPATGLLADPDEKPTSLASHPPTNIIEEGYVRKHGDWYYLWESVDYCCRGVRSTYRIWVGRSKSAAGPFKDFDGRPMTAGGGTLVLAGYGDVHGPGSCATIEAFGQEWMIHHMYDGAAAGAPTLQVRPLFWSADGWPAVGEPIVRGADVKTERVAPTPGDWTVTVDYTAEKKAEWAVDGTKVKVTTPGGVVDCDTDDDGKWFVGRDKSGRVWRGVKRTPN